MKRVFAMVIITALLFSLAACSNSDKGKSAEADKNDPTVEATQTVEETSAVQETTADGSDTSAVDISGWNWVKGELDCYGYNDCYMSYEYPDNFKTGTENSSGLQYRGYNFNPSDPDASANNSPYGIYVYFNQGSYGAKRETLEADIAGGFTERELGGRKVLFGALAPDPNTGVHTFSYYVQYDEEEYARIWFIVCDPEEDGAFRKAFEESISFTK